MKGWLTMDDILENLSVAAKTLQSRTSKLTKQYRVTIAEWKLLRQIKQGVITQDAMAEAMQLDNSTLSRQLKNLTEKQFTSKTAVGKDRRQLEYALTPSGEEALLNIDNDYDALTDAVFHYWPEDEQQMMKILLKRLARSIERAN